MKSLLSLCVLLGCAQWQIAHAGSAVWKVTPTSSDWTRAANWTPKTVPNGPADVATFAPSNVTNLSLSSGVEVAGIVFNPGANAFTITNLPGTVLTVSGAGITNNSGLLQNFVNQEADTTSGELHFTNHATAGDSVVYTNQTPLLGGRSPLIQFEDSSSASSAQFYNQSGKQSQGGLIQFEGNSTAANGTFRNTGDSSYQPPGIIFLGQASAGQALFTNEGTAEGIIGFYDTSTADHATITNEEGPDSLVFFLNDSTAGNATVINQGANFSYKGGITFFMDNSTAGNGTLIADGSVAEVLFSETAKAGAGTFFANGGRVATAGGGLIMFTDSANAENGTFDANGGQQVGAKGGTISIQETATAAAGIFHANGTTVDGSLGGRVTFSKKTPTAGTATLIATAGVGTGDGAGGAILFQDDSVGDQARVEVFGNGRLDIRKHKAPGVAIGSLEGDGVVTIGALNLTVGSNSLSTTFSGTLQGDLGSSFTKGGAGTLTYTGSSTLPGVTTVTLGTLGGHGTFAGAVTIGVGNGTGAVLAPAAGGPIPATLTTQGALTFKADGTYTCTLSTKKRQSDQVSALGVTIDSAAQFKLQTLAKKRLTPGQTFVVLNNTSSTPISGTFANLADGATVKSGNNQFQASYAGGDGNDLTLTTL